jgi:phage portal protein BeeE
LFVAPRLYFPEFNVEGLMRGDTKSRYDGYAIARNWGWLSVNEIRAKENMNPIGPEGDVYLQPLNMSDAGSPSEDDTNGN